MSIRLERLATQALKNRTSYKSKVVRKLIDRSPEIKQIFNLDEKYYDRYNKVVAMYNKKIKGMSEEEVASSRETIDLSEVDGSGVVQLRTANKIFGDKANFRQIKNFYGKLVPELLDNSREGYEFGHQNISVLRANMAAVLSVDSTGKYLSPAERKQVLALYQIVQEIDNITEIDDSINRITLVDRLKDIAEKGPDLSLSWKKDVSLLKGTGTLNIEAEYKQLNQFKGNLSSWVGSIFAGIIREDTDFFNSYFSDVDVSKIQGSPTFEEDIENSYLHFFETNIAGKKNFTAKKPKKTKDSKTSKPKRVSKTKSGRKKTAKRGVFSTVARKGVASSPMAMIALLNQQLPKTVMKNMESPALENRTGRFAQSVRVTDVSQTTQGFPSVGYTYRKSPYQTFEKGGQQGSQERDPRKLIDGSIREIAAKFAIGRFYTRRV